MTLISVTDTIEWTPTAGDEVFRTGTLEHLYHHGREQYLYRVAWAWDLFGADHYTYFLFGTSTSARRDALALLRTADRTNP